MSNGPLRIEQYETVRYDINCNPLGVPDSVTRAIMENISAVGRYPDTYYDPLRNAIASYACCAPEHLVLGSGSSDLLRLFVALLAPKKALLPIPSATDYEHVLSVYGCETDFYELDINQDYHLDMDDFIAHLSDTYDIVILGNPNNPTSQLISKADIEKLAAACKELGIALLLDEMYIEFTENYERNTAISLVNTYDNLIILRSVSEFFSVPGLRLAYAIMNNETNMTIINMTATPNSISCLTAAACTAMLEDTAYIHESHSRIFTERNLIYAAMNTNKNLRLFKPSANFALMQILKEDVTAKSLLAHCNLKGIVLRNCENFHGLDSHFVRFSIMNPMQNDLMVNTILELLR